MWVLNAKGELESVLCDICGKPAGPRVQIANIIVGELCEGECTRAVIEAVKKILKTKAGPPDVVTNKGPIPETKDGNHDGQRKPAEPK